jgi:hypothetical protein
MILLQRSLEKYPSSTRSGSLFLRDGQYVGSPVDRCFKLFLSIVFSTSRPLGVMSLDSQLVCLTL